MTSPEIEQLQDIVAGLIQKLDDLERAQPAAPRSDDPDDDLAPPDPRWWRQRADPTDWARLRTWVADITDHGSLSNAWKIPPCWDQHPGLVEDLAAAYEAWRNAMVYQQARMRTKNGDPGMGSMESSMWMTQAYWPLMDRLAGGRYRSALCDDGHQPDRR